MSDQTENRAQNATIILSGTGGQGLQLMGRLLAEAGAIDGGLNVVQSRSYGPEARGGASRSQVVLSRGEIDDLRNPSCNVLICLSQQACDRYYTTLRENGLFIVDSTTVHVVPTTRVVELPMAQIATDTAKTRMAANVVALGVLSGCSNLVTLKALESATRRTVKERFLKGNLKALAAGYAAGKAFLASLPPARRSIVPDLSFS